MNRRLTAKARHDLLAERARERGGFDKSDPQDLVVRRALFASKLQMERESKGNISVEGYYAGDSRSQDR